jgi:hypothetical protein
MVLFDFLKKHKPQGLHIIPDTQQELKLSVRQRALNVFSEIEGLNDIKEMLLRALESAELALICKWYKGISQQSTNTS